MAGIDIAIIGAGLAGLACARALREAGRSPVLFDKSRGVGGRLSTRRAEGGLRFDHGAQFVTALKAGFSAVLRDAQMAGRAAPWDSGSADHCIVGTPGMNNIAKHMAEGLDIWLGVAASTISPEADGWRIETNGGTWTSRRVVLAVPAPQAVKILGKAHPLAQDIAKVQMAPCLALMASFEAGTEVPFQSRRDPGGAIDWIALNSSKPDRWGPPSWVAHASSAWSLENLELPPEQIAGLMLPMLCDRLGVDPSSARHVAAHRWRYARVTDPLGVPFARNEAGTLYAGGDWCLGARAEYAWESGTAIAQDILGTD